MIAAVNGMAVGGGFELALSADLIIAADHARFALPEIKAGTLAEAATVKLPKRIPYHVAMEMLLLGRWMSAEEAKARGIVTEIVPGASLMDAARAMATVLAEGPPLVFAAIKEVVRESETMSFHQAMKGIARRSFPTVARLYTSEDQKEGAKAFAEKRPPQWRGC